MTYRTLLVGLGKIGFGYSGHTKKSDALLTHTAAILSHQDFELTLGIDPNPLVRAQFEDSTKLQTLESVSNIRDVEQFDLVVIATPTQYHEETLREILRLTPRAVLMEKPLSPDLEGAKRIKELLQESDVKLAMNFQRSYTLEILDIARKIALGDLPGPYHVNLRYTGIPKNAGTHILSIIQTLFPAEYQLIMKDGNGSCIFYSEFHKAKIVIERVENFPGNIFEFTLLSAKGEIAYNSPRGTITERGFHPQEYYENEITIEKSGTTLTLSENKSLGIVYDQLSNYLSRKEFHLLEVEHGINNNLLIELFLESKTNEI